MTSAPSRASTWPTSGPAQYAVMSSTRSPLNGSAASVGRRRPARASTACSSRRGAGSGGGGSRSRGGRVAAGSPHRRAGWARTSPGRGSARRSARSRRCTIGAFGMRNADARSSTSSTVCSRDPLVDRRRQRGALEEQRAVLGPLGMTDHHAEVEPLLAGPDAEADQPVAGGGDARRRDVPALAHRSPELVVERDRVVREAHRQRLEHRHVDELALVAGAVAAPPACRWRRRCRRATRRSGRRRAPAVDRARRGRGRRSRPTTPGA